jgi:hypothetical protein
MFTMDETTMARWAAIGGFEADVRKLFQRLNHQAEIIGILRRTIAAMEEAQATSDQIIAALDRQSVMLGGKSITHATPQSPAI